MLKRLSHISLSARNLDEAVCFYQRVFNCQIAHEFKNMADKRYGVFLDCGGGTYLEIFQDVNAITNGGPYRHICFEVDDIEAMATQARSFGHDCIIRRGRTDQILQFMMTGPDQVEIEIHQPDERSTLHQQKSTGFSG